MSIKLVNCAYEGQPQYRIGDAVLMRQHSYGKRALHVVLDNPELFNQSVLFKYGTNIDSNDPSPQFKVLESAIKEFCLENSTEVPGEKELTIHLRLGDLKGFKHDADRLARSIKAVVTDHEPEVELVTIVTAIHYGRTRYSEDSSRSEISESTSEAIKTFQSVMEAVENLGMPVSVSSRDEIDLDFCYLANARLLLLGNGHFSLCAALASTATCFVPEWIRTGSELRYDNFHKTTFRYVK